MKELIEFTNTLAKEVIKIENSRKNLGGFLRKINSGKIPLDEDILEERIITTVERLELQKLKIAGVDGGLVKKSLHGVDIRLSRAIGVIFNYSKNKLEKVEYHPSPLPTPIP
ncbi:MAG: hypothetical protein QMD14_01020, partial [Candidatus Aenigmarchaeota archaeon]|nr:hypothetical protein [Candidatus Aenigmarchaeota archaeon]